MFDWEQYELLDFGNGRKLERFDDVVVERPCPAATETPSSDTWEPTLRYNRARQGRWVHMEDLPAAWTVQYGSTRFELSPTATGQVGLFPEQAPNWRWLAHRLANRPAARILNLFAYTGGSTLAAVGAGAAQVTHVDAAKSVVHWARRNAAHSGMGEAPIRWIVDDARKFVAREIKRGNRYDGVILDPPSYGHGPKSQEWKLARDLFDLLDGCKQLLSESPLLFLLTCHTPGFGEPELNAALTTCLFGSCAAGVKTRDLALQTGDGRRLASGHAAYWP